MQITYFDKQKGELVGILDIPGYADTKEDMARAISALIAPSKIEDVFPDLDVCISTLSKT